MNTPTLHPPTWTSTSTINTKRRQIWLKFVVPSFPSSNRVNDSLNCERCSSCWSITDINNNLTGLRAFEAGLSPQSSLRKCSFLSPQWQRDSTVSSSSLTWRVCLLRVVENSASESWGENPASSFVNISISHVVSVVSTSRYLLKISIVGQHLQPLSLKEQRVQALCTHQGQWELSLHCWYCSWETSGFFWYTSLLYTRHHGYPG